jgi:hypothetical protein
MWTRSTAPEQLQRCVSPRVVAERTKGCPLVLRRIGIRFTWSIGTRRRRMKVGPITTLSPSYRP